MSQQPWWNGTVYIVAPNQTPSWIRAGHPQLRIVDQDALFPEEDMDVLPQFNTNAIEQWLWRLPGLTEETFVHMNDDYIFTSPIEPQVFPHVPFFADPPGGSDGATGFGWT